MKIKKRSTGVVIMVMDMVYRLTPAAWTRYAKARARGEYPEPGGRGWKEIGEPIRVTDMEDEDFKEYV